MFGEKIVDQVLLERNLAESTLNGYNAALKEYSKFFNMKIEDLIGEALTEEDEGIALRKRKVKQRLIDFRMHLISKGMTSNSIRTYFSKILAFYRHFSIEIPQLPQVSFKSEYESSYHDLPTRQDLIRILNYCDVKMQAVILFMLSSGCAKAETLSLKVQDFIGACDEYHSGGTLDEILDELKLQEDVVPTFYIKRQKTGKHYTTFCSPEATGKIVEYLQSRLAVDLNDKLFDFTKNSIASSFQKINDDLNFGWIGSYRFFRTHVLRKYHASNLNLTVSDIDALQGRARSPTHEAYIKPNPKALKKKYVEAMADVMIYPRDFKNEEIKIIEIIVMDGKQYRLF